MKSNDRIGVGCSSLMISCIAVLGQDLHMHALECDRNASISETLQSVITNGASKTPLWPVATSMLRVKDPQEKGKPHLIFRLHLVHPCQKGD